MEGQALIQALIKIFSIAELDQAVNGISAHSRECIGGGCFRIEKLLTQNPEWDRALVVSFSFRNTVYVDFVKYVDILSEIEPW